MMKKIITILGLCTLISAPVLAAQITLQSELVPRVLNGEEIYPAQISAQNAIEIDNGENQLAMTVGQIVFEDGKRRKFDSQLLLLTFDAQEHAQLALTYDKFRTIEEAKAFEKNPVVALTDENGNKVSFSMVQLNKGGLQGFRDYQREVADYRQAVNKEVMQKRIVDSPVVTQTLKTSFNELSREDQQAFMQWAMSNLK